MHLSSIPAHLVSTDMRVLLKIIYAGTLSVAAMSAETKTSSVDYGRGAASRPKAARQARKPLKWLRRACSAEVEFPLWLSSRGISKVELKPSNETQSFRFAVAPENRPEVTPAGAEDWKP